MQPVWKRLGVLLVGLLVVSGGAIAFAGSGTLQQDEELASFEVSNFTAPNTTAPTGNLTVSATVTNPNDQQDRQVVKYRFDGTVLAQQFVTLEPGESTEVTFTVDLSGLSADSYVHGVFTQDTGEVAELQIADSFRVTGLDAPPVVPSGETLTVNATVSNPTDVSSTQEVEFRLNGEVIARQDVELGAGESTEVTFEVDTSGAATGQYFTAVLTRDFGEFQRVTIRPAGGPPDGDAPANVSISNQSSDGTTVVVDSVTVEEGGFVAIHDETLLDGNVAGSVIGVSEYLEPGTYENLTITLFDVPGAEFNETSLEDGDLVIAMPHFDTGENERYDFVRTGGQIDGAYTDDDGVVIDSAIVSIGDEPTETPTNETDTPTNETETPADTPTNETDTPTNETETPTNETDTPTNETDTPTNETDTPTNETDTPTNETDTPAAGTDTANGTTAEPVTLTGDTDTAGTEGDLPVPGGALQTAFLGALSLLAIPVFRS